MLIIWLKNLQIQKDGNWKKIYLFCCYHVFIFKSVENYFVVFWPTSSFQRCLYFSWSELRPYIFPSFSLLGIIIQKIISDKVQKALLIIPFWPAQSWFSLLRPISIYLSVKLLSIKISNNVAYCRIPFRQEET